MKIKKQYPQTKSFEESAEKRFGKAQCEEWQKEAALEVKILKRMHTFIQSSVDEYMQIKQVGKNELSKKLHLSSSYISKMKKGQANLTIGTFAHVMATLGKDPFDN